MSALKPNKINFLDGLKEDAKREKSRKRKGGKHLWFLAACLLVILAASGYYAFQIYYVLGNEMEASAAYIGDEERQREYAEAEAVRAARDSLAAEARNLRNALESIESYPDLDRETYGVLAEAAAGQVSIEALSFSAARGVAAVSGSCEGPLQASAYAGNLRRSGSFADVDYYGYESGTGGYVFQVYCYMTLPGGEADE
ncbi:MAG: hypothetical protein Q4C22_01920 [Bacillota bacterium]|nr:hypothetical protein [Bacillota bacterium]